MKLASILIMVALMTGCSTVAGLGKDIQSSAEWTKEKMSGSRIDLSK